MIARLRPELSNVAGIQVFLQSVSTTGVRSGGRQGNGDYQYSVQADSLDDLNTWVPKITAALSEVPELQDVNSDQQSKGLEIDLKVDRATAARLGLNSIQIDNTLQDAFAQRQVSTIYKEKNQYHVIMEVAPAFWQDPQTLRDLYVSTSGSVSGTQSSAATNVTPPPPVATASAGSTAGSTTTTTTSTTTTAAALAAQTVLNQLQNSIAGGHGS